MPPIDANDPVCPIDHDPGTATPGLDHTADFLSASSAVDGATTLQVPGQGTEPMVAVPARDPGSVSVPGYTIERELGRGGIGVVCKARHLP